LIRRRTIVSVAIVAAVVIAVDQITKAFVTASIDRGELVEVIGPLKFTLTYNDGVAFGLAGGGGIFVILLSMVALVALGAFIATAPDRLGTWLAGGLILGGALGNMIDRVRIGHVTDFILLPGWPAFNIADASITVGVVLLAWTVLRHDADDGKKGSDEDQGDDRGGRTDGAEGSSDRAEGGRVETVKRDS
jgi:signal peptidase II